MIRQTAADTFKDGATAYLSIDPGHCASCWARGGDRSGEVPPSPWNNPFWRSSLTE